MIVRLPTSSNAEMKNCLPCASIGPVQDSRGARARRVGFWQVRFVRRSNLRAALSDMVESLASCRWCLLSSCTSRSATYPRHTSRKAEPSSTSVGLPVVRLAGCFGLSALCEDALDISTNAFVVHAHLLQPTPSDLRGAGSMSHRLLFANHVFSFLLMADTPSCGGSSH